MAMNFVTFNQDYSCLAVGKKLPYARVDSTKTMAGTSKGFRIYHTDPFAKIFSSDNANVAIIEMLFSTSLVALIKSPRHLVIQNTKVGSPGEKRESHADLPSSVLRSYASLPFHLPCWQFD